MIRLKMLIKRIVDYSAQVDQSFRLCWPTIPISLINQHCSQHSDYPDQLFRWIWSITKSWLLFNQDPFIYYRLLIDLSPSIFIVCDFGTILSSMASANAPPPSLLCHPPTSNCEHNIVECILYLFSNTSNISCCSMLLVLTNSHSSRIRRSHFSYCLILFLYVPCILDSSNSDNKSGSRIYLTFSPLLHASTPSAHPIYDFP